MEPIFTQIATSLVCSATLAMTGLLSKQLLTMRSDFRTLKEANRNQLKDKIVATYINAQRNGRIEAVQLEAAHRCFESYEELGGNSYIHALMDALDDMEITGDIPAH